MKKSRRILLRDYFGSSILINRAYRQKNRTGDVATVVLILLPHIQNNDLLGIHHLFGCFLGDLLIGAVRGISAASGQQQ